MSVLGKCKASQLHTWSDWLLNIKTTYAHVPKAVHASYAHIKRVFKGKGAKGLFVPRHQETVIYRNCFARQMEQEEFNFTQAGVLNIWQPTHAIGLENFFRWSWMLKSLLVVFLNDPLLQMCSQVSKQSQWRHIEFCFHSGEQIRSAPHVLNTKQTKRSRSCQETSYRHLVQRHCIEICCALAKRFLGEILPRELF